MIRNLLLLLGAAVAVDRLLKLGDRYVASRELADRAYAHEVGYEPPEPDDDDGDDGDGDTKAPSEALTESLAIISSIDGDDRARPTVH